MNDQINESISAMVDGQTDDLEVRRMLKALDEAGSDAEVQAIMSQWERYQIIGANIRGEQPAVMAAPGFAAGVSAAIANESGHSAGNAEVKPVPIWRRFAVAATVALAVVVGVQEFGGVGGIDGGPANFVAETKPAADFNPATERPVANKAMVESGAQLASATTFTAAEQLQAAAVGSESTRLETAEAQRRLNEYLLQHTSHAAQQSGQGMIPFARLANFEEE